MAFEWKGGIRFPWSEGKLETNLQQMNLSEEQAPATSNNQKNNLDFSSKIGNTNFLNSKTIRASHLNWELVSNLSARQRTFYFNHLEKERVHINLNNHELFITFFEFLHYWCPFAICKCHFFVTPNNIVLA